MPAKVALSLLVLVFSAARSKLYLTVPASKGSPLWNFAPRTSLKVQLFRSGDEVHELAKSGVVRPSGPILVSVS
jgi:hypothetical protein